jgi:Fe(3+) dicitrate transport protein
VQVPPLALGGHGDVEGDDRDAGARYRVLEPLDIYLNVRNVFDSHALVARHPFGARPNAPRWVQVGAKVKF